MADPEPSIRRMAEALGLKLDEDGVAAWLAKSSTSAGLSEDRARSATNPAGARRNWLEDTSPEERMIMHGCMADTIGDHGYLLCDCLGRKTVPQAEFRNIDVGIDAHLASHFTSAGFEGPGYWRPLGSAGKLEGRGRLRLRTGREAPRLEEIASVAGHVADLCATASDEDYLAGLLGILTNLELVDLRRVTPVENLVPKLAKSVRTVILDETVGPALLDQMNKAVPGIRIEH